MTLGPNELHPLQIADARDAAFRASELQRRVEDDMRDAGRKLATAEEAYRRALSFRIYELHEGKTPHGAVAWTLCEAIAKGEDPVAELRRTRDDARVELEVLRQQAYRRGADRADVARLLTWSMNRELRTDTPPADWTGQGVIGGRRAA